MALSSLISETDTPPAILNALADPVFVVGAHNEIAYLNQSAEQFFQASMAATVGMAMDTFIPEDSPVLALIRKVRTSGNSVSQYDVPIKTPRIGEHVVTIDAAPLTDRPESVVVTLQQRSIAGRIDRSLTHRGAARSVSAMALMLAHEIKNPLSGVRGAAQLLEQTSDAKDRELTRLIIEETDRICALVDRMEMFTDNPRIERKAVNIHEVLNHVVRLAQNGFGSGVRFVEAYDPSLPLAFGDRDQLIQIFLNLVKNAVEAAPDADGEVVVSTAYQQGVSIATPSGDGHVKVPLVVRIQDNGPGVPEDLRGHLFDPFISTKPGGSGLGLALVAKFVGDHGGVIDMDTHNSRTVFRVMLPMMDGDRE